MLLPELASQREDEMNRALSKAQAIRVRLGGSASMMAPFPAKPKGMRWSTYYRLQAMAGELWVDCLKAGQYGHGIDERNIDARNLPDREV